jgi:hypothetical protein
LTSAAFITESEIVNEFLMSAGYLAGAHIESSSRLATKSYAGKTDHGEKRPDGGFQDRKFFWIERGTPTGAKNFS